MNERDKVLDPGELIFQQGRQKIYVTAVLREQDLEGATIK